MTFHEPYPSSNSPDAVIAWHQCQRDGQMWLARKWKCRDGYFHQYNESDFRHFVRIARWHHRKAMYLRRRNPVAGMAQMSIFQGKAVAA